jgi:uncharacterized protein (DUF427 family)
MALDLGRHLASLHDRLRFHPVGKRIRASHAGQPVLDTTDAMVVWEPRRVVPMYAVPRAHITATLTPCTTPAPPPDAPPVVGPVRFGWHFHDGESFTIGVGDASFEAAGFVAADPDLGGRVIVEWAPFDWVEEDTPVTGHPHDPFKRIDVLPSSRHVVVSSGGTVLADTTRAVALYETGLPVRWYVPRDDVRLDLLEPSAATSVCAYKGQAAYFSQRSGDGEVDEDGVDIAWTYADPLHEAAAVKDHVCFYAERTDLTVDGVDLPRPDTLWRSRRTAELA